MRKLTFSIACLLCTTLLAGSQTSNWRKPFSKTSKAEGELIRAENLWNDALVNGDENVLKSIHADDFIPECQNYSFSTKEKLLAEFLWDGNSVNSVTSDQFQIRIHGNTAIVNSRWTIEGSCRNQDVRIQNHFTDTWLKRGGKWRIIATHGSRVEADADPLAAVQELSTLVKEWDEALVKADGNTLGQILASGYRGTDPDARTISKQDGIAATISENLTTSSLSSEEMIFTVHGDTAVVTGKWTAKARSNGKDLGGEHRFTETWVKRHGRWEVVADHWSRIPPGTSSEGLSSSEHFTGGTGPGNQR